MRAGGDNLNFALRSEVPYKQQVICRMILCTLVELLLGFKGVGGK